MELGTIRSLKDRSATFVFRDVHQPYLIGSGLESVWVTANRATVNNVGLRPQNSFGFRRQPTPNTQLPHPPSSIKLAQELSPGLFAGCRHPGRFQTATDQVGLSDIAEDVFCGTAFQSAKSAQFKATRCGLPLFFWNTEPLSGVAVRGDGDTLYLDSIQFYVEGNGRVRAVELADANDTRSDNCVRENQNLRTVTDRREIALL